MVVALLVASALPLPALLAMRCGWWMTTMQIGRRSAAAPVLREQHAAMRTILIFLTLLEIAMVL